MRKTVEVQMDAGMEARPIALMVQTANQFSSHLYLEMDGKHVNAKSIMGMMSLVLTNGVVAEAKVTREQVRAKNKETLQAIIDNKNISEEQKKDAIAQMVEMTALAEKEVAVETLLASKGFKNAVVSLTKDSADIVVGKSELTDANRAQIEDIVTRKTDIAPANIVITPIHEKK